MSNTTTTNCYQCAAMGMPREDMRARPPSQCDDCMRFFCYKHAEPKNHVFFTGKKETCATRTVRLMRVLKSKSVATPGRRPTQ